METTCEAIMDQRSFDEYLAQLVVVDNSPPPSSSLQSRSSALNDYELELLMLEHQAKRNRQWTQSPARAPLDLRRPIPACSGADTYNTRPMIRDGDMNMSVPLIRSPPLTERLEAAVQAGDLSEVQVAFEAVRDHDLRHAQVYQGYGLSLHFAIENQHKEIVQYLLSQGVEPMASDIAGAARTRNIPILELLFEEAWDINKPLGWHDPPALDYVVEDGGVTAWFLAHGADPNATSNGGMSPLAAAVQRAPFSVVEMMFANGANAKAANLLHDVIGRKHHDRKVMVEYLIQNGASINAKEYHSQPLAAAYYHFMDLGTAVHCAAACGDEEMLRILISHGAALDIEDAHGCLAIELAERGDHKDAAQYLRQQQTLAKL